MRQSKSRQDKKSCAVHAECMGRESAHEKISGRWPGCDTCLDSHSVTLSWNTRLRESSVPETIEFLWFASARSVQEKHGSGSLRDLSSCGKLDIISSGETRVYIRMRDAAWRSWTISDGDSGLDMRPSIKRMLLQQMLVSSTRRSAFKGRLSLPRDDWTPTDFYLYHETIGLQRNAYFHSDIAIRSTLRRRSFR